MRIAILQPLVPHYRSEFYNVLRNKISCDIFITKGEDHFRKMKMSKGDVEVIHIPNRTIAGKFLLYNPLPLLKTEYDAVVLMMDMTHITTWIILFLNIFFRKNIILWGQAISVPNYMKEEMKCDWKKRLFAWGAKGMWIYMEKEAEQWKKIYSKKKIVALNNTISGIRNISDHVCVDKNSLRIKYGINHEYIVIYCARFNRPARRTDLLVDAIDSLDSKKYGFIIIGDGDLKPDFSKYANVYDFGKCYDNSVKQDLFDMADIYFQPGWLGLSVVEAMGYGKPVFTFKRSSEVMQCVEYSYVVDNENGKVFDSKQELIDYFEHISIEEIERMGNNARELVRSKLQIENMVSNALSIIQ